MKELLSNVWVKRCVSIFTVAYAAVITLLTYATFLYDLEFVPGKQASFLVIYAVASLVFMLLMIYSREILVTRIISVLLLPIVFCLLLFNMGNWILFVPAFIVAIVIFFAAGTGETLKVIMGTIYLLLYVLGIVAYVVCNMLFGGSDVETLLDIDMDKNTTVYTYYRDQMAHLSEVMDEENTISPDGRYRFYLTDVKDSNRGCVKIYVVPHGQDINLKFFSLNQKGIKKTITRKGTRGVVPDVGWTVQKDADGKEVMCVAYRLTESDPEWQVTSVSKMPDKNYFEFLGISL
ncbi:MAG: hypothetical protein ACI4JW_10165 [Oscillospiraceae bacterium]